MYLLIDSIVKCNFFQSYGKTKNVFADRFALKNVNFFQSYGKTKNVFADRFAL